MENLNAVEDQCHVPLSEPVDLEELCKPSGKGTEFEVCVAKDLGEPANFFDNEKLFQQLNNTYEWVHDVESADEEDQTPSFERLDRYMDSVIEDGGVKKKVLRVGSGDVITLGYTATIHYNGFLEYCDEPFDSTRLRNEPMRIQLGEGRGIEGLEIAIMTMRKGELSQFLVRPEYAYRAMGIPPRIPGNATILFEIELLRMSASPVGEDLDSWTSEKRRSATFQEILEAANAARKAGNEQYEEKDISGAAFKYGKAIRLLENAQLADQAEEDEMNRVLLKLCLNMSICNIKQSKFRRALANCNKALEIDSENLKAIFRRGQALLRLGDLDQAQRCLARAMRLSPRNSAIAAELKELDKARAKHRLLDKQLCGRMFTKARPTTTTGNPDSDKEKSEETANETRVTDSQISCPPEARNLLKTKLKKFLEDGTSTEMPFALDTLTEAETEYIHQAALEMGLGVRTLNKSIDRYLKIFKHKPEGVQ